MTRTLRFLAASGAALSTMSLMARGADVTPASATEGACIAIVLPVVQGVSGSTTEVATGLRELLASYLSSPSLKVMSLETRLASQAGEEATRKGCEPLLIVTLTRKAGGKNFAKALGQAAGNVSWYLPGGSTVTSTAARVATSTGLQAASSLALSTTKAKDEVRLEYRLQSANGQLQLGPASEHQTASVDGEDLVTPLVTRTAEAIAAWRRSK